MTEINRTKGYISRRDFLKFSTLITAGAGLAACEANGGKKSWDLDHANPNSRSISRHSVRPGAAAALYSHRIDCGGSQGSRSAHRTHLSWRCE